MKRIVSAFSALIVACLLISCAPRNKPAQGAQEWIDAIVNQDGNKILKHTCLAQRENLQQTSMWASAFPVLSQVLTNPSQEIEGDISDLEFETVSRKGNQAEVQVSGELRVSYSGMAEAYEIDERWPMVREDDTWRWCGSGSGTLPRPATSTPAQQIAQATPTPVVVSTLTLVSSTPTSAPEPSPQETAESGGPVQGAQEWIDALVNQDGNRMLKHTCLAQREGVQETSMWFSAFAVLGQLFTNRSVQIEGDVSDLKFETVSQSGDQAQVRVYGELRMAVLGAAEAQQVDERWLMVWESETWRWCGPIIETPSLASDSSSDTPLSGASAVMNGLKLDVVEIRPARSGSAKEGWKRVEIVLSAENVSETVGHFPSGFCGTLVDTGGYERQASSTLDHQGAFILAPGIRVKQMVIQSEIPLNQEPQSLTLYATSWLYPCANWQGPSGPGWSFSDLSNPVGDLEYPYDTMPTIAPTAENGVLQHPLCQHE